MRYVDVVQFLIEIRNKESVILCSDTSGGVI